MKYYVLDALRFWYFIIKSHYISVRNKNAFTVVLVINFINFYQIEREIQPSPYFIEF